MPTWQQIKKDKSLLDVFKLRQEIITLIREFFSGRKYLELFTPILQPAAIPESYLDLFSTEVIDRHGIRQKRFLIPSPEVSVKKLLVAGVDKCFEITRGFRNRESGSNFHNPEFTIMEWYRTQANYMDIMKEYQELFQFIYSSLYKIYPDKFKNKQLKYQQYELDLTFPWEMISVPEALEKYCGISFDEITDKSSEKNKFPAKLISRVAEKKGYKIDAKNTWEEIFNQIYMNDIDPQLGVNGKPTVIYDYPAPVAALAKLKDKDDRIAERFEVYMGRLELADCCTELTDAEEQSSRFKQNLKEIKKQNKNRVLPDTDFLSALATGLPPASGIAMGVDRLVMLFANKKSIRDTILTFT